MLKSVLLSSAALAATISLAPAAEAFDCAKASSDTEKAICADPTLQAADDAMSAAYAALLPKMSGDQPAMLKANQIAWLKQRESNCGWQEEPAERTSCLLDMTTQRTHYFTGTSISGPGAGEGALKPYLVSRPFGSGKCSADVALYHLDEGAGAETLNAWVDNLAAVMEGDYGSYEQGDLPDSMQCDYGATGSLTYASPDLIAMNVTISMFGGGAHGNMTATSITLDRKTGKAIAFDEVFSETALAPLAALCTEGIKAEKLERFKDYGGTPAEVEKQVAEDLANYATTIEDAVGDLSNWLIYEDHAEVFFAPYALGSYAEGTYQCALPKAELQKVAGVKGWIIP